MTQINCKHLDCLNNRRGECSANRINLSKKGYCCSTARAQDTMKHDYDIVHRLHGTLKSKGMQRK